MAVYTCTAGWVVTTLNYLWPLAGLRLGFLALDGWGGRWGIAAAILGMVCAANMEQTMVLAILLLAGLLGFGLVKEGSVAGLCDFLQGHLTFLFLPAGVGLLEHLDLLASSGLALAAVCMVSGFFTFAAATLTVRLVQRIQKGGRREGTDL